ncbi:cation diffusion facilitator family transporter [Dethiosulfatarculus sandiegensis]|uniref:Metal transporter n=1 Tax=Dethiosulfatarculus sandiegensis TaxID=1429043 RepID=A0A0D2GMG1_9BACT|nr:cation diffusion facilitator family transporter [Dethiosulfatarculus sandiegensis]KIX15867.1 metal transporter [Dethiosulfatarculus sandiegensis]
MNSAAKETQYRAGRRVVLVGAWVNLFLIFAKFLAGHFGNSQALIADAVHSFSDLFTDFAVIIGLKLGKAPPDKVHHFGHGRLETLISALVGLALIIVAGFMGWDAADNAWHGVSCNPTWLAIVAALASLVAKEALFQYTMIQGKRTNSPALKANAWHHRTDAMSSLAVMVGVTAAWWKPEWAVLDAYAALVVSVLIFAAGVGVIWDAVKEFTDSAPDQKTQNEILDCALRVPGVERVHDLRVRTTGGRLIMELHVVVDGEISVRQGHDIANEVEKCLLAEVPRMERALIHVDPAKGKPDKPL